jgi:hypothetical protein
MSKIESIAAIALVLIGALIAAAVCADPETLPLKPLVISCLALLGAYIGLTFFKGY